MSETDALRALMEADRWIDRVTSQRSHLPEIAELASVEGELTSLLGALREAQAELDPVRSAYDDAQREAQRLGARASDLNATLSASSANARELAALHKELDHVRELLSAAEDRELEYLLGVEPLEATVDAIKLRAQPLVQRRSELQRAIADLQATLDEELSALREQRTQRADEVSAVLLARYDAAFVRAGTSGAAQVDNGRCDGCRIVMSPLDVDRWKAQADGSFMACPECGRLLLP